MELITALLIGSLCVLLFFLFSGKKGKTPPGPYGLPLVGYIPFMSSKPYVDLQELGKTYGGVFSLQLGSQYCIILDDYQSTKDAFAQDAFLGRPPENVFDLKKATLETGAFNGLPWKEQRRFSLQILKDLGFGKSHLEDMMKEETRDLLDHLAKSNGQPIKVRPVLSPSMSNNIACLVFGKRLKYDDPDRMMLDRVLSEGSAAAGQVSWQLFFPGLTKVARFLKLGAEGKVAEVSKEMNDYIL
ncbi:Cytochrome P450 18a1 [Araneus ventricosus]|uniref:Cytochrome P450 18a1 n=1 Tax=Araneus ventricosus TaxID=182803 RepID=A0A4Y2REH3_ARAVE|nr:Cytochrome P450 18a1 [Araneus ventricosus]